MYVGHKGDSTYPKYPILRKKEVMNEAADRDFSLKDLSALPTFVARKRYCDKHLGMRWGTGSSRTVYDIDDDKILKLAINSKGIAQNQVEVGASNYSAIVVDCLECDNDYKWIVQERCLPARKNDFSAVLGTSFAVVCAFILYSAQNHRNMRMQLSPIISEDMYVSLIENDEWFADLDDYIGSYNCEIGDLVRLSSWGMVQRNGTTTMVILDSGLDNNVWEDYYMKESRSVSVNNFLPKNTLSGKLWDKDGHLNSRIRLALLDIADTFFNSLSIPWVKPKDIVLTGSLANYNWNKYSDMDIHIIVDYKDVHPDKDMVKAFFDAKKFEWGEKHDDLKVKGFPVEMYMEDSGNPTQSSGVYSLNRNEWVKKPKKMEKGDVDMNHIKNEFEKYVKKIDGLINAIDNNTDKVKVRRHCQQLKKVFDKLKKKRKKSLMMKKRELASDNIIWKMLRAAGYIRKINDTLNDGFDREKTITESLRRHPLVS